MSRPLALAKLPQALRDRAGKTAETTTITYLLQAADAIEKQNLRIKALQGKNRKQKKLAEDLESIDVLAQGLVKKRELDWSDVDTTGDWWDAEPNMDELEY